MSDARTVIDAIRYTDFDSMGMANDTTIGETFGADAILAALAEAGLEIRTRGSIEALEAEVERLRKLLFGFGAGAFAASAIILWLVQQHFGPRF